MKAAYLLEMPNSCYECPLTHSEVGYFGDIVDCVCVPLDRTNIVFMDGMGKPNWCPLIKMPQKRILPEIQTIGTNYGEEPWFSDGWNECLDTIESMNT